MSNKRFSLSDVPLEQNVNDFGTEGYVQGLERFISHAATPTTIALQGEWGSGKTSLMNRLYNDLCGEGKEFVGININTWEYSMLATPEETVIKIIGKLVSSLTEHDTKANSKAKNIIRGVLNFAWGFGREFIKGVAPGVSYFVEGAHVPGECPGLKEDDNDNAPTSLTELKKTLAEAIEKSLSDTNKQGILIFVDDLDRLNPPLAVQLLELLKNIFTLNNCIFVLAIDYDVVVKGLEPKFGKLSDANEREFRSFFDKIIQVPFSLPVNNYKPMSFVLNSLAEIGYFTETEKSLPYVENNIEKIVVSSVGKNPRSIKRLINTLSLLDCIGKCAAKEALDNSLEAKVMNFAIVAMQICYPKIYNILSQNPIFDNWDETIASKLNLQLKDESVKEVNGEVILDALCEKDVYLSKCHKEILDLLEIIDHNAREINESDPATAIKEILDRSSYTNVNASNEPQKFDGKYIISRLHNKVWDYISKKRTDIQNPHIKRNTGKGGYCMYLPNGDRFDVIFYPTPAEREINGKKENIIALKVLLNVKNARPKRLSGLPYEEVVNDPEVQNAISPLAETVERLSRYGIIEGRTYGNGHIFNNIFDEYRYCKDGLLDAISGDVEYWINQKTVANFEDNAIISAIGDLIIAAYEMNCRAAQL